MAMEAGTRLGPYEVLALLGAGGMGEVYRARDTTLGRDVALKTLPASFAGDPERLARFEREAKTLASLNHPHIAQIYGFERAGDTCALVMELVEGEDLSQRIARGALPLDEARADREADRRGARRGARAGDHPPRSQAREHQGARRRRGEGAGLRLGQARSAGVGREPRDVTASPTITSPARMTGIGVILGTAAYMSPEQAKGREADRRSDIWAFGAVLYEMLTGRRAFDGEDMADVLGAVVRLEPNWEALPADVPLPVRTLLQGCLVKDRGRRVADISTALFVLDKAASLAAPAAAVAAAPLPRPPAVASRRHAGGRRAGSRHGRGHRGLVRDARGCTAAPRVSRLQIAPTGTAALSHQRQQLPGDRARWLSRRLRGQQRHATLRPCARCPRARGGVHLR